MTTTRSSAAIAMLVSLSACGSASGSALDESTVTGSAPPTAASSGPTAAGTRASTDASVDADSTRGSEGSQTGSTTEPDPDGTGETSEIPPDCGDGILDPDEDCDDGNATDADGCNNDCRISGSVQWFHTQAGGGAQSEDAFGIAVDDQGRAYVAGSIFGGVDLDIFVRQYTEDEGLGWTVTIDGGAGNDSARDIVVRDQTLYVTGTVLVAAQSNNIWLRTMDPSGEVDLSVQYNGVLSGSDTGWGVAVDPDGNIVVGGSEAIDLQGANAWVREYSPAGVPRWTAGHNGPASSTDQVLSVATDGAGNVAAAGYHTAAGPQRDIWVALYDTEGTPQWTATYAGPSGLDDEARGVDFDRDGNVVVAGEQIDAVVPWQQWVGKYDPSGALLWTQVWDGATGEGARAFDLTVDTAGDIIITGQHRTDELNRVLVRKLDPDGNERWTASAEEFPGPSHVGRAVTTGPGREIWVAGGVNLGVDARDILVARLAP